LAIDWNQVSSAITAIATVGLAIYAYKSFKGVKDQMDLIFKQSIDMKRQADAMEIQSTLIRSQSDAMARQADTMDSQTNFVRDQSSAIQNQARTMLEQAVAMKDQADTMEKQSSLMLENMEHDRLTKKYERINKEIASLVGPLYGRRKDLFIFSLKQRSQRIIGCSGFNNFNQPHYEFNSFWDAIDENFYLNRSIKLQEAIVTYNGNIDSYFELTKNPEKNMEAQDLATKFNNETRKQFINIIEERYAEITKELKEIEAELRIQI
jgi:hypothetical protein